MNKQPLVSIIIPTFNRADLIAETLDSIKLQTYQNWECIIVDDGSTDNTFQVVQRFIEDDSRFQFFPRPKTLIKGGNSCRNYGFTKINGQLVQWFDSDDLLVENAIGEKVSAITSGADAVLSGFSMFEETKTNIKSTFNIEESKKILESYLLGKLVLNLQSFICTLETVKNIKFSETLTRAQDLDFVYTSISRSNLKIVHIPKAHSLIRLHEKTITAQFSKLKVEDLTSEILVREKIFFDALNFAKKFRIYPTQRYFNALKKALKAGNYKLFYSTLFNNKELRFGFKLKLYSTAFFYKVTGRGLSRYNTIVNRHFL